MLGDSLNQDDPYAPTMKANAPMADQQRNNMQAPQVLSQPVNWNTILGVKKTAADWGAGGGIFENMLGEQQPPPGRNLQDM